MAKNIGCCYFDKSTKGQAGHNRPKNRWRAQIQINGARHRQYVNSYQQGMEWCKKIYDMFKEKEKNDIFEEKIKIFAKAKDIPPQKIILFAKEMGIKNINELKKYYQYLL